MAATLLIAYSGYMLLFGLMPFEWSGDTFGSISSLFEKRFDGLSGLSRVTSWDIWSNVLFFVPFGLLLVLLPTIAVQQWSVSMLCAAAAATLLSAGIELAQLFFSRAPSLADILCNSFGGIVGGALGICLQRVLKARPQVWFDRFRIRPAQALLLTGHFVLLLAVIGLPLPLARDFSNWDPSFRLFLGNEGSADRAWRGAMYLVAIYNRALSPEEVRMNFSDGPLAGSQKNRPHDGLLLYYDFSEQRGKIVHDRAGGEVPVELQIGDPSRVEWVTPNGLLLSANTVVSSAEPPEKVAEGGFSLHNQLSVEAWVAPADLAQTGPARIVSYSFDAEARNFTLGQQNREVVFRLRTPVSGENGTDPDLVTDDSPLGLGPQHLVATYRNGIEILYINGLEHLRVLLRSHASLSDMIVRYIGEPFKWLVYSALIFPLGILTILYYQQKTGVWVRWLAFGTAFIGLLMIQASRALTCSGSVELHFLIVGACTLLISVFLVPPSPCRL